MRKVNSKSFRILAAITLTAAMGVHVTTVSAQNVSPGLSDLPSYVQDFAANPEALVISSQQPRTITGVYVNHFVGTGAATLIQQGPHELVGGALVQGSNAESRVVYRNDNPNQPQADVKAGSNGTATGDVSAQGNHGYADLQSQVVDLNVLDNYVLHNDPDASSSSYRTQLGVLTDTALPVTPDSLLITIVNVPTVGPTLATTLVGAVATVQGATNIGLEIGN